MAIPEAISSREYNKFGDRGGSGTFVYTSPVNNLLNGILFDAVSASYPDLITEVYAFKQGGLAGTTVATVTVVYTDESKDLISTVVKT